MSETERRQRLEDVCTGLPELVAEGDRHILFAVRDRTFAYYHDYHYSDGRIAVCCKAPPGDQEAIVAMDPERFYLPAYLACYGWSSLRLNLPTVDRDEVSELIVDS